MKKVCIIHTGGTIGMKMSERGLVPERGYLAMQMEKMSELFEGMLPDFEVHEYDPLIDSSNLVPEHWMKIARDIESSYESFDGFVILHGTDSMAYTSSILPFMLEGLNKSVVITGAQLPLGQVRNDARENLKTAMMLAANYYIPEVSLFFGEVLLRGCRATKASATKLDAFHSPNYPVLGSVETNIEIFKRRIRFPVTPPDALIVHDIKPVEIATFRLFPGMSIEVLKNVLMRPLKALIIESYGVGNGPDNPEFINTIRSAVDDGIVIVNCTQCRHGCVTQTSYATGTALSDAGVVSGRDMTVEAAIAKLYFLFSQEEQEFPIFSGRMDAAKVEELVGRFCGGQPADMAFVCGPDTMIETVTGTLLLPPFSPDDESFANFLSSRGPSVLDGTLKPDISAPGVSVVSANGGSGTDGVANTGTSMATPFVAGAAAIVRQAFSMPSDHAMSSKTTIAPGASRGSNSSK